MSLKTSLFNKSIIKSDLKRYWWVSALELLALMMLVFALLDYFTSRDIGLLVGQSGIRYLSSRLFDNLSPSFLFQFSVPVFLTVLLFGYLNKVSAVSCMHSLPLKRSELFFSHIAAGMILSFAPIIVCCIVLLCSLFVPNVAYFISAKHIMLFGIHSIIYALVSISFTSMICMLVGNMIAGLALTYIFALLPLYIEQIIRVFLEAFLHGYPAGWFNRQATQLDWLYCSPEKVTPLYMAMLIALSAVCLAVALLLYRRRALENYGEIVAFPRLKPIFTFGTAVCAGFLGFLYFCAITNSEHILYLLPFGLIGIIIAHMLMKRQFTLRGAHRPMIVYCIFVLIIFGCFKLDITGYERRVPELDEVKSVRVYPNNYPYNNERSMHYDGEIITFVEKDVYDPVITDASDIEKVIETHKYSIENRRKQGAPYTIEYELANGRRLIRRYCYNLDAADRTVTDAASIKPVAMLRQLKAQRFSIMDGTPKNNMYFEIYDRRVPNLVSKISDAETVQRITDALILDLENISFEDYLLVPLGSVLQLSFNYHKPLVAEDGRPVPQAYLNKEGWSYTENNETYVIRPGYTNTLAVLNELDLMPQLLPADYIDRITLRHVRTYLDTDMPAAEETSYVTEQKEYGQYDVMVTDRAQIEEIYNFCRDNMITGHLDRVQYACEITIYFNNDRNCTVKYYNDVLPEFIKNMK